MVNTCHTMISPIIWGLLRQIQLKIVTEMDDDDYNVIDIIGPFLYVDSQLQWYIKFGH